MWHTDNFFKGAVGKIIEAIIRSVNIVKLGDTLCNFVIYVTVFLVHWKILPVFVIEEFRNIQKKARC